MKNKITLWFKLYKMVWTISPLSLPYLSLLGIIQALTAIGQLYIIQSFINNLQESFSLRTMLRELFVIGIFLIIRRIYNAFFNYSINKTIFISQDAIRQTFITKAANIPLYKYYESDFETQKSKALQGSETASLFLIIGLMLLSFNIPYFIFFAIYYCIYSPALLSIVVLIIIPSLYAIKKNSQQYKSLENQIAENRKKIAYYNDCISGSKFLKETKLLNAQYYFHEIIKKENTSYISTSQNHHVRILKNSLLGELVKYIGYCTIIMLLIELYFYGNITLGLILSTITSLNDMYSVFSDMMDRDFKTLASFYVEVENFFVFIQEFHNKKTNDKSYSKTICLNNVSYKYPNSSKYALKDINIQFEQGKTYAIVGENGCGKSTLIRVILGLLKPTNGTIVSSLTHENTSVLFQNFGKYPLTIRENVYLSKTDSPIVENDIEDCLNMSNIDPADSNTFPDGLDTILSKEFGGIELSGGLWQRVALARSIYSRGSFVLLDEPTSAIDAFNESDLFNIFKNISRNKTSIIITHRLGLTSIADYIVVLDKGRIVEFGTHSQLLENNGKYKKLYTSQAKNYF